MRKPKTAILQSDPGHGKSRMACLTAVNKPVHVIDMDRKIGSAEWAMAAIEAKELTYWELAEAVDDTNLRNRLNTLAQVSPAERKGPTIAPRGIATFAEYVYSMPKNPDAQRAGTWVFDSATALNEHAKAQISFIAKRDKFAFDQWAALKTWWMDTFEFTRDLAREYNKDLIWTVHERVKENPGERVTGARVSYVDSGEGKSRVVEYVGQQDVDVWASIDGAFGGLIGSKADEYYYLYVEVNGEKVEWKCRVQPDGRRALRTSFNVTQAVFPPDFARIWK